MQLTHMRKYLLPLTALTMVVNVKAQQVALTADDYKRAESQLIYNTEPLVDRGSVRAAWLPGDKFTYRVLTPTGSQFMLVDPAKKTSVPAFDAEKLAIALNKVTGKQYDTNKLPFTTISFSADMKTVLFPLNGKEWGFNTANGTVAENTTQAVAGRGFGMNSGERRGPASISVLSPDGKLSAFIKDWNLWVKDMDTKQEKQLTTDGIKDFGYATDNAGWKSSDAAILLWSPDSKKIATFKQDQRNVSDMYLVTTNVGKPTLKAWKYPLPGDKDIAMIQRVVIDVANGKVTTLQVPPDPHRSTLGDDISSGGTLSDVDWSDGVQLAFVSTSRDHKNEKFRIADPETGAVREVFEETVPTQFESGQGAINWRYLHKTDEIIWYSERDNWGHLYLYDATTGKLKNQITKGDWTITRLLKVDEQKRVLYFIADGGQAENPYFSQLYKVGFDGKGLTLLTPAAGNHTVTLSPALHYFVDTYSKPDVPPVTELRTIDGKLVCTVDKADISRLVATGWHAPTPFSVKAADGKTDIYGLLFTPTKLDATRKYPVIDYIYPGPQGGSVGNWGFASARGDNQALAELGFVVVVLEGTANPLRSKNFHDMSYGNMAINTLPDQIAGIRQLSQKYAYMDTTRVGIWGHSGGGFATAAAMFRYPDFFKVGISESGNHDNRNYEDDWGERYDGLTANSDYEAQANQNYAKNLKGKLMLAHGLMDNNVPPYNTLLVVDALEKANKDYDLVVFPNSQHGYGAFGPYMMRRRWDYFVKNLQGAEPPKEYLLKTVTDPRSGQ